MAYGQTSSGKTHTMQGYDINDKDIKGLIPRIVIIFIIGLFRFRIYLLPFKNLQKICSLN
jgi:hypothetical protein